MRAAIYARYSSENQRPESIDDQVRACHLMAAARGLSVGADHVYTDEAKSGALRDRPGLEALCAAARNGEFEAVLVDDLSRLSHDNHFLLTLYAGLRFHGIRIISRADSLDSEDRHAKLGFQMRGIVNELYLAISATRPSAVSSDRRHAASASARQPMAIGPSRSAR